MADAVSFGVETVELDLPALAGAFTRRLHEAGMPVTVEQGTRFADALAAVRPVARRRLYWTARAVFVSDRGQIGTFDIVFASVFGGGEGGPSGGEPAPELRQAPIPPDDRPATDQDLAPARQPGRGAWSSGVSPPGGRRPERQDRLVAVPMVASREEVIRGKRFDALGPEELVELHRLMAELALATPVRRTRRAQRSRHGDHIDLRRTLRGSLRTGGDPMRLARRRRRVLPRRVVLLCDISGSMEPYARAYLQFLTCAAGRSARGNRNEAFVFATRLTRLTRALHSRNPDRAIQQAAAAAPDWSSGTRIGDALKEFNDRHGRRGMARGAVIVILSDGWERGDPSVVGREMARLGRLAYRIVWVNPRVAASDFSPRAGGMAAALPHCDALVSGHSLQALHEVVEAIAAERSREGEPPNSWRQPPAPVDPDEDEPWASATPVPGSSVAMPSGYGPSRGRTTPGWGQG
jgi:uncharacterized protein